jgi:hypothetical protein
MGVVKGIPEKGQNRNRSYRTNPETVNRSQQDSSWLNLTIEKDFPFKKGIPYRGVTNGLEKCPITDGREQARLKATLINNRGNKKSFYKYFDMDMFVGSKFIKFLRSMNAIDANERIILEKLENIAIEATLFETKSGSLYIAELSPVFNYTDDSEDDIEVDETEDEMFEDETEED